MEQQKAPLKFPDTEQETYVERVAHLLEEEFAVTGKQRLCYTHSYGCQQNVSDGERMNGLLAQMGFGFTNLPEQADFILYNTCAVREHAEDRVFGNLGALKHYKRKNPELIIGICGCMPQQSHITEKIKKSFPYVDLIFGTHVQHKLPQFLYELLTRHKRVIDLSDQTAVVEKLPVRRDNTIKAFVPVMYGCDNFCSYCVVPLVRGRERSRSSQAVLQEIEGLVRAGYKEIMLLGQNVNSYGKGLNDLNFAQLLRRIQEIPGDFWVRFMTSHPKDATPELFDAIGDCSKICRHVHLPVQSGSDRILKEMNRHYSVAQYRQLVEYAKKRIPGVTFTSDIMVGFPGETRADFEDTLRLIEDIRYDALFTFLYSRRSGTRAAVMPDVVNEQEKTQWFQELLTLQGRIGLEKYKSYVGQTVRVLLDGESRQKGCLLGRTEGNTIVEVNASKEWIGKFATVHLEQAMNWAVHGVLV